ncbi:MAG: Holliday junction branch migration protein RuvA [Dehalococcoidia bacterium]|nr:Holliday junction branch migration protein RuvA [Dehalococcoidia bacterium]
MITGVRGLLEAVSDSFVVVAVGGVSLKVFTPNATIEDLGKVGDAVRLHTQLVVREDDISLYGFPTTQGLRLFQLLVTVSGIGPKSALGLLGAETPEALAVAIVSGNTQRLQKVPGIGKKTAERLVLELREKMQKESDLLKEGAVLHPEQDDALDALVALGYTPAQAQRALGQAPSGKSVSLEDRVRHALQKLASS